MQYDTSEFTKQNGRKKRTAKRLCVTKVTGLLLMCFAVIFTQKDLFKEGCSSAENFFNQNYCHACHTRFADSFPLPSSCVSSLLDKTGCEVDYAKHIRSFEIGSETGSALCQIAPRECFEGRYR